MKYILYVRKSTEGEERQALSIESQIIELKEFATKEKLEIVASFQEAKTAKEPGRTKFAEMINLLESGVADGILAWHPDRLARNSIDGGKIVYLLDIGQLKDLKFPSFWFDNTPQGKFMLNIAFGQSKYYVDNLSENIKRGNRQKLRKGLWPSFAPIGYLNNHQTKGIDVDKEKAPLVKKAFKLYASGEQTLKSITKILQKLGLRSYRHNILSISCIHRMLNNPIYYGIIKFKDEIYPAVHEPIISQKLFNQVQSVMNNRGKKKRKKLHNYSFTGLMKCGTCDCSITAEKQKGYIYYRCTKKKSTCDEKYIREELLVEQLKEIIKKVSISKEYKDNMLNELDSQIDELKSEDEIIINKLNIKKIQLENKLDKLLDMKIDNLIDNEEYAQKKNLLITKKISVSEEIIDFSSLENNRLERMKKVIIRSCQAKKILDSNNYSEILSFLKDIGSNFILKGKEFRFKAKIGYSAILNSRPNSGWRRVRDSNPRNPQRLNSFQDCPIQPLWQLSKILIFP